MGAIAIPIVIVVLALVGASIAAVQFARRRRIRADEMRTERGTLHYNVPNGHDPADIVLELSRFGYEVVPIETPGAQAELLIGLKRGEAPDRERTRQILAEVIGTAGVDAEGLLVTHVRFTDE